MTTPQPTQRDKKSAMDAVTDWRYAIPNDEAPSWEAIVMLADSVSLLLAQREAEVRAEYAAFADEHGEPRNIVGNLPVSKDGAIVMPGQFVYVGGQRFMLTLDYTIPVAVPNDNGGWRDMHIGECFAFRDAALAARKEGE
jgi:hypothetical protein